MKTITLSVASGIRGNATNKHYPVQAEITSLETLLQAVQFDHVAGTFRNNERCNENFISADSIIMDCDNDHSETPGDWLIPETISQRMKGVAFAIVYSKSHMRTKKSRKAPNGEGYSQRPRFHVYFPLSEAISDNEIIRNIKESLLAICPEFDAEAKDAARFIFGVEKPQGEIHEASNCVDEVITVNVPRKQATQPQRIIKAHSTQTKTNQAMPIRTNNADINRVISQFTAFIYSVGIRPLHSLTIIPDSLIHRFSTQEDALSAREHPGLGGAYKLCLEGLHYEDYPTGWVKDFRDKTYYFTYDFSPEERRQYGRAMHDPASRARLSENRKQAERRKQAQALAKQKEEQQARQLAMAEYENARIWFHPTSIVQQPYFYERFVDTGIYLDIIRCALSEEYPIAKVVAALPGGICREGELLIPMRNINTGDFQSLIRIPATPDEEGNYRKTYYKGLGTAAAAHWLIPQHSENAHTICVCEGIATGLAVLVMGNGKYPVFSAGTRDNLASVCKALRSKYTKKTVVIFADNDEAGITAATQCKGSGYAHGIRIPPIQGQDWYDYVQANKKKTKGVKGNGFSF